MNKNKNEAEQKRVSILILAYNNEQYLERALLSVLMLNYPNIEIIVSDDCSPNGFDIEKHIAFIESNKRDNLKNYIVRQEPENVGTVKHIKNLFQIISGDYYLTIGADDFLGVPDIIDKMVSAFESSDREEYLVMGNIRVWSKNLEKAASYLLADEKALLYKRDPKLLLHKLTYRCCIPTVGVLYSRKYLETVGEPDTNYMYAEDWHKFIEMAQMGITPLFINEMITNQVRGGISNGNAVNSIHVQKRFIEDKIILFNRCVEPIAKQLPSEVAAKYYKRRDEEEKKYMNCEYQALGGVKRLFYLLKNPRVYFWKKGMGKNDLFTRMSMKAKMWPNYLMLSLCFLTTWMICSTIMPQYLSTRLLSGISFLVGSIFLLISAAMFIYKLMWVNQKIIKRLLTKK